VGIINVQAGITDFGKEKQMAVYQYGDRIPTIGKNTYISDSARVIGDVVIQDNCYIGHGAIVRGDYGTIHIGMAG
jgi:carbonic anhydrase/acetyltransferase-like protein (isoleucine patch superfamily)